MKIPLQQLFAQEIFLASLDTLASVQKQTHQASQPTANPTHPYLMDSSTRADLEPRSPEYRQPPSAQPKRTSGLRKLAVALGIAAAAVLGSGLAPALAGTTTHTESARMAGTPAAIRVTAHTAAVTVKTGDVDRPTFSYQIPNSVRDMTLQQTQTDASLTAELTRGNTPPFNLFTPRAFLTVTLPTTGEVSELVVETTTGSIDVQVNAKDVTLRTSTGRATYLGDATVVKTAATTGSVDVRGTAHTVDMAVTTGSIRLDLSGAQPDDVNLTTTTGAIEARLPAGDYSASTKVTTGSINNRLAVNAGSPHNLYAKTTTGSIILR